MPFSLSLNSLIPIQAVSVFVPSVIPGGTTIPSPQEQVLLPKKMYFPSNNAKDQLNLGYVLFQSTVYRIEDPEGSPNDGWLIMVSEPNEQGKFCFLNPFTMKKIEGLPDEYFPKELNSLEFRVTEVCKSFTLKWIRNEAPNPAQPLNNRNNDNEQLKNKAVLSSNFESDNSLFVINDHKLFSVTIGEDYWSLVNREIEYRDIAGHNGYVYVVDRFGIVVAVQESSYNCITIPVPYPFLGDWFLVKSGGDLLLVGRDYSLCDDQVYYHNPTDSFIRRPGIREDIFVDFKIHRLEETEDGEKEWTEVEDLGDTVLVLSRKWSFAIDASDFDEIEGNHIIFVDEVKYPIDSDDEEDFDDEQEEPVDEFWGLLLEDIKVRVYDVEETFDIPLEYQPEYHKIFWPPPEWLRQYRSPSSHQTDHDQ
ncbi:hypothetical protein Pint_03969 [Pistacia integerrima]|uniref:Uncharacterized protein n=1 Tax=Pistacia integerrima TaxID=434235 RepID=A0ACC0Z3D8_9ROSI|nr:hypothetical protein Pint_03969 [Pistacia integerrima]